MDNIKIIKDAYAILNEETPMKYDCGRLCDSLCCKDNGEGLGMWLLPGEKEILKEYDTYTFHKSDDKTEVVVCNGVCNRDVRPYACRIYPYYPSLTLLDDGYIDIIIPENKTAPYACEFEAKIPTADGGYFTVTDYASAGKLWTEESKMAVWMNTK